MSCLPIPRCSGCSTSSQRLLRGALALCAVVAVGAPSAAAYGQRPSGVTVNQAGATKTYRADVGLFERTMTLPSSDVYVGDSFSVQVSVRATSTVVIDGPAVGAGGNWVAVEQLAGTEVHLSGRVLPAPGLSPQPEVPDVPASEDLDIGGAAWSGTATLTCEAPGRHMVIYETTMDYELDGYIGLAGSPNVSLDGDRSSVRRMFGGVWCVPRPGTIAANYGPFDEVRNLLRAFSPQVDDIDPPIGGPSGDWYDHDPETLSGPNLDSAITKLEEHIDELEGLEDAGITGGVPPALDKARNRLLELQRIRRERLERIRAALIALLQQLEGELIGDAIQDGFKKGFLAFLINACAPYVAAEVIMTFLYGTAVEIAAAVIAWVKSFVQSELWGCAGVDTPPTDPFSLLKSIATFLREGLGPDVSEVVQHLREQLEQVEALLAQYAQAEGCPAASGGR